MELFARLKRSFPYGPVLATRTVRRMLAGIGISSIGDGLSTVAISWLMLRLAPPGDKGVWVAFAVAAYNLPGAFGAFLFAPWLRGRSGAQLASWDAILRTVVLLLIPLAYFASALQAPVLVGLLGASSLMNAWGKAGRYVLLAEILPAEHRLAGNAVINMVLELAYVAGPPLAALLLTFANPSLVIGIDALTFGIMAAIYRYGLPADVHRKPIAATASRSAGFAAILRRPTSTGLVAISLIFFFLFGFVTVALPVYIGSQLRDSAGVLAGYFTAFGIGGFVGASGAGYLRRWPVLRSTCVSVLGVGLFLLPLSAAIPPELGWISFGVAGLFWGPFPSTSTAYFQGVEDGPRLASVLAARTALQVFALPAGNLLAGPIVVALGGRTVLLLAGSLIVALAAVAGTLIAVTETVSRHNDVSVDQSLRERI
ncbi:MAG: MFS transporter [Streptosporangiaceae bacterium]